MKAARDRFFRRALIVLVGVIAVASGIAVAGVELLGTPVADTGFGPLISVIAVILLLLGLGGGALWNGIALVRLSRLRPDAVVFLARRDPTLAPDLPVFLHRKDVTADVSDKWVPAMVDTRGISAWTGGPRPRELFLMAWGELGVIEPVDYRSLEGHKRYGIAVDVRPFPDPLIVRVGYSTFGLQAPFDRAGTAAVAAATNGQRGGWTEDD